MTSKLKVKLFNFKNQLTLEQQDVASLVEQHMSYCDAYSEIEVTESLTERLRAYTFFPEVKSLVEGMKSELEQDVLLYELKDAYKKIDRKNQGAIYSRPMSVLLDVINSADQESRMEKIVTELAIYDWVPEIKQIMFKVSTKPSDIQKYSTGAGRVDPLYTIAPKVAEGHLAFVRDKWFIMSEGKVEATLLETHITDADELRKMRLLEEVIKTAEISDKRIDFHLSENLTLGLSVKNPGRIFLNESEAENTTTLEDLFQSPIVPYIQRGFYPVVGEAMQSIEKFVELDVVTHVSNKLVPHLECYAFNYGDANYLYNVDKRYGSTLLKYESATMLIEDVMKGLGFDLTHFYGNKVSKETKTMRALEDAEKQISEQLDGVQAGIAHLEADAELMAEETIKEAHAELVAAANELKEQAETVRVARSEFLRKEYAAEADAKKKSVAKTNESFPGLDDYDRFGKSQSGASDAWMNYSTSRRDEEDMADAVPSPEQQQMDSARTEILRRRRNLEQGEQGPPNDGGKYIFAQHPMFQEESHGDYSWVPVEDFFKEYPGTTLADYPHAVTHEEWAAGK